MAETDKPMAPTIMSKYIGDSQMQKPFVACKSASGIFFVLSAVVAAAFGAPGRSAHKVKPLTEKLAEQYQLDTTFYKKCTAVQGILIATSNRVSDLAHLEAAYQFDMIMQRIDEQIARRIRDRKVLCILIGSNELTSEVPQFATDKTGEELDYYNWRSRGFLSWKGGRPTVVFAEEDVLEYEGGMQVESILIHEFAHVIHGAGFDKQLQERLTRTFAQARARGLWNDGRAAQRFRRVKSETPVSLLDALTEWFAGQSPELIKECLDGGSILVNGGPVNSKYTVTSRDKVLIVFGGKKECYAGKNRSEYWAEGVQNWYDTNRTMDHDHNHIHTRQQLKAYDPGLAKLCEDVLGDSRWRFVSPRLRAGTGHLKEFDPARAPKVDDPEHIKKAANDYYDKYWKDYWQRLYDKYPTAAQQNEDTSVQLSENPPMQTISRTPPPVPPTAEEFDVRKGFTLITTLEEFRAAIKKDNQKLRMKPGIYRAEKTDPPIKFPIPRTKPDKHGNRPISEQQHIFAVTGSHNHFDLRGAVFETPVSVQSKLSGKAHVADTWHINGTHNTFEGAYFRNIIDKPYPHYRVTENEFEICNDNNSFIDCTFVINGSIPYGYTDYYGKGGPNFGRLNKHSFMSINRANNTTLIGCKVYLKSFGHCVHFHGVDGVLIEDCYFTGTLRPTNDIFKEKVGRAVEYDFNIMYRGKRPIPRDHMIPLTEDGIRSYGGDKNITVINTTVERMRGCFQLLCDGDVTLENVTVLEAGDFSYDLSSGDRGKIVMKNCRGDIAYNPLFNLTRGDVPKDSFYEITILSPADSVQPTPRTSLGTICGDNCTFIFHDGTTHPLPEEVNRLSCGGKKPLTNSTVTNYTAARLVLNERVRNCTIKSVGPVEDNGKQNKVIRIRPKRGTI